MTDNAMKGLYMEKKSKSRTFRPDPEVQKRLEFMDKLGMNVSEVINEVLSQNLEKTLHNKVKQLHEMLEAPAR